MAEVYQHWVLLWPITTIIVIIMISHFPSIRLGVFVTIVLSALIVNSRIPSYISCKNIIIKCTCLVHNYCKCKYSSKITQPKSKYHGGCECDCDWSSSFHCEQPLADHHSHSHSHRLPEAGEKAEKTLKRKSRKLTTGIWQIYKCYCSLPAGLLQVESWLSAHHA